MKVLICEDDQTLSSVLRDEFEDAGLTVIQAFTMKEAHDQLLTNPDITVVTMDGQMPVMRGGTVSFTDMLVEQIHKHNPDLKGKVFALAGSYENRDRLLIVGAVGVPGRRQEDQSGTVKPYVAPVIQAVIKICKG